jgi:L-threonylcarbamoyladenylate synthase
MATPSPTPEPREPIALPAQELAVRISSGSAAIFPTDTLPALAALPATAGQLWVLKGRPAAKPMILMGADSEALFDALEQPIRQEWRLMAARCWPGAVTIVLPARGALVAALQPLPPAGGPSLGLRIPASPAALDLLRATGPLATTSANASGADSCRTDQEAAAAFPSVPLLAPVPWPSMAGPASTVIAWTPRGDWQLLRAGAVIPAGCRL